MRRKDNLCTAERKNVVWMTYNNRQIAISLSSAKRLYQAAASWVPFIGQKIGLSEI